MCLDGSATHSGKRIPPSIPSIEPRCIPVIQTSNFSTNQITSNQTIVVPVCVCKSRSCTFLEIKLRAWAYLTSMLLVLAASSLRMEYMSDIASRPDRWRSSEYNEYLDICISRSASSTSLWATVSENLSLAKAWNGQAAACLKRYFHMVLWRENSQVTYNRDTEYAQKCSDSCVGGWCIWLRLLLADAGICSCNVFLELSRNRRNDSSSSRYVCSVNR